jgi:hypothetical protein
MLSKFAYMLAGRNTSHGVKFCESLPTAHVLAGCDSTSSLYRIGKCITNTNLQDLLDFHNIWHTGKCWFRCLFCTLICPQPVWNKSKELFLAGPTSIFPGLDNRHTCFTLDTNRRCLQTTCPQSKVPDQHLMSQSQSMQLWTLIVLSATDGICRMVSLNLWYIRKIQLQFKSAILLTWSHLWYIQRSVFVPFSDFYFLQNLWDWWVFVIYAIPCTVPIITAKNHIPVRYIIHCTELVYHGDCQNISETVFDNNNDDDNLDWICSCSFNEFLNWIFLMIFTGSMCLSKFTLLIPFTDFCVEPTFTITFKNQEKNMVFALNRQSYTNYSDLLIFCAWDKGKNYWTVYLLSLYDFGWIAHDTMGKWIFTSSE